MHPSVDTQEQNMAHTDEMLSTSRGLTQPFLSLVYIGPFQMDSCIKMVLAKANKSVSILWEAEVRNREKKNVTLTDLALKNVTSMNPLP